MDYSDKLNCPSAPRMMSNFNCPMPTQQLSMMAIRSHPAIACQPEALPVNPKRHIASFFKAVREEQTALCDLLAEMQEILVKDRNPNGFNIGINVGEAAGHYADRSQLAVGAKHVKLIQYKVILPRRKCLLI